MSSYGQYAVDMAAIREAERRRNVRQATEVTLAECTEALGQVSAKWLSPIDAQALANSIGEARGALAVDVDLASRLTKEFAVTAQWAIQAAKAAELRWTDAIAGAQAALAAFRCDARSIQDATVDAAISMAERACELGDAVAARKALTAAEDALEQARARAVDEAARRQLAIGVMKALEAQGFSQAPATVGANGKVVLLGRLPSGRTARFEIALDGYIDFDLNGYTGRECGKDLEAVRKVLRERFALPTEPVQFTWRNPDRLSAGARPLPTSRKENV